MHNVDKRAVTEIIKQAKALIQNEQKWIKGVSASRCKGSTGSVELPFQSKHATCFCATGAVRRAAYDICTTLQNAYWWRECDKALIVLDKTLDRMNKRAWSVEIYNDKASTTHADIMTLFDRAIALAEANEKEEE